MNSMKTAAHPATVASEAHAGSQPIANYALLADCNSAALVGSRWVDRLAVPAALRQPGGVRSAARPRRRPLVDPPRRRLQERTALPPGHAGARDDLHDRRRQRAADSTRWRSPPGQRGHDLGFDAPHELLRSVEGIAGEVELVMELAPRPEYGLVRPLFRQEDGGGRTFGGPNRIAVRDRRRNRRSTTSTMRASFTVAEGEQRRLRDALGAGRAARAAAGHRRRRQVAARIARHGRGAGAPGRPSTTSTRARTASWSASARAC